ncbi:hypothetical protein DSO57_1032295 [Entomophthora muscae]|uniref:Uncharacterized protein n=1 Tax=Entomophthora muscae TaxID=34485 RepID=A0ACC2UKA3_9FUNG|nr:hypothetical protein DSO57_1032295 [Entomophthora muscae]
MNTFNFFLSVLCLALAATSDVTNIVIKDNVNYVLKLGTCKKLATFHVNIQSNTTELPYLFPKFEKGDDTVAKDESVAYWAANVMMDAVKVVNEASSKLAAIKGALKTLEPAFSANQDYNIRVNAMKVNELNAKAYYASLEEDSKRYVIENINILKDDVKMVTRVNSKDIKMVLDALTAVGAVNISNTHKDLKEAIDKVITTAGDIAHSFPGHFKIADFKHKELKLTGTKKTDYEVYVIPPNAHKSADSQKLGPTTFYVNVYFKCGDEPDEESFVRYRFTVTSNACAVSLVSSTVVLAATFFLML